MRQSLPAPTKEAINHVSPLDGQAAAQRLGTEQGESALQGLIGIESLQHSARLAGLAGGVLLILVAVVALLGTSVTRLDSHWLTWAALPALLAAFGGPLFGNQLFGRRYLTQWRFTLVAVMTLNAIAWVFAATVALKAEPVSVVLLVIAGLAVSLSLLPTLAWFAGLVMQLGLLLLATFAFMPAYGLDKLFYTLGLWVSLSLLALMAAVYARRVDLIKGDAHYLRFESSELQQQIADAKSRLDESDERCLTLESELAEILDLAEDASRAKTEFLATMSHEIRTPLNGILPILEMLQDTRLTEEQRKLVDTAQSSSRHLLRIINDILDFAKVESGKLQLEAIEIDVRDLVDSVTELMSGSARNHNLKLSASVAQNVPHVVRGDPIRLRQVLINLVSNAIKFTEEGGIRVEVSRGQTSQKEVELLFAVADTGVGMSAETADRLFQSFTQADASTTRKHGGTGLGLVICKRLVELMGGKIGVRSAPGQGSTFWFLVPLRKSIMEVPSARTNLKGVRILTLIPDPEIAARVAENLSSWGVAEDASSDTAEALAKLRSAGMLGDSRGYALVLIDGTGIEQHLPSLLAQIREMDATRRIHILLAVRSESLAQKLRRDYGVLVLQDALRPEPLRRVLHRLFDVESRNFGNPELRAEEIYDDLNVSTVRSAFDEVPAVAGAGEFSGHVLLVEDNPVNLGVVQKALSRLGLSCVAATDGNAALAQVGRQRFDMIFMDCQMPVMDGYEATRRIRQLEREQGRSPAPIVAMTANAMAGDREKCIAAGMDDYLAKPVNLEELRARVLARLTTKPEPAPWEKGREPPSKGSGDSVMPVIDEGVLRELKEIMEDDYLRLLHTYLHSAPQLVAEVQAAIDRRDVEAIVNPVHSLKSSSANVGAMQLSDLAREVERLARGGNLGEAERAFAAVDAAFDVAEAALRRHVAKVSAA
jgi:signal transduction histidine kinase/DNA-binding response OmpR family regulator/HPt (histidine-containing phosphotransfer) domain-containing protein